MQMQHGKKLMQINETLNHIPINWNPTKIKSFKKSHQYHKMDRGRRYYKNSLKLSEQLWKQKLHMDG